MRKEMIATVHASHIGMEGCIRRARDSMFWPQMTTELREYVSKCDIFWLTAPLHRRSHCSNMISQIRPGQK